MIKNIDNSELEKRISLNAQRLSNGDYYKIDEVFSPSDYDWYGDKEGRALLAFVSHYEINGTKIPCMEQMMTKLPSMLNSEGYFGPVFGCKIHEQQLSGHSWLLRGLCEYYEQFGGDECLNIITKIAERLYITKKGIFSSYPVNRHTGEDGGVSGSVIGTVSNWILSSDIGCAFMSIDGLSHAYKITNDTRIKELIDEMCKVYLSIDKVKLKAQTHCTLTAARGMVRMYSLTKDNFYLCGAKGIFRLYEKGGMTRTYQNLNWWGRPDTWTEPCAVIDSLMLALELYKNTQIEHYREVAARIYHNGFSTLQRPNGGAGTDTVVLDGVEDTLHAKSYEAYFCCTMRLAEGLRYIKENAGMLYATTYGSVTKKDGVYCDGDILYAEVSGGAEKYAQKTVTVDGHKLCPIVKYYDVDDESAVNSRQKILF